MTNSFVRRDLIDVFQIMDNILLHFLSILFVHLFLHLFIVNPSFQNVVDRSAVNGSTSSLIDDLEVEPPQKTKPNC